MVSNNIHKEKELFARIAEGDEDAFNELYLTIFPDFTAYIFQIVKSQDAVAEVIQESLIRFWLNRYKLPEIDDPRAWLSRIIINECYRYLRKHGLRQRLLENLHQRQIGQGNELYTTDRDVSYRETQQIVQQAVANLTPRQREIFRMSREEGLKLREIAQKLDVSQDYVKKTLMAALRAIRQALTDSHRWPAIIILLLLQKK